jgi:DNA-binding transcriptional LysR family regulator
VLSYVHLHTFCTVMRLRSLTAAASSLGISQPAVSQQIAKLEETMGLTLFFRIKGQLEPTADARSLLEEAERTLQAMERLTNAAEELRQPSHGLLRIAAYSDVAQTIVADVVAAISARNPGVRFAVSSENPVRVTEMVAAREADVGVSRWAVEQSGCRVEFVYTSPVVAVLPPGHPLCALPVIRPADLDGVPVVLVCRRAESRMRYAQVFREAGAQLSIRAETHSATVALALVARGLGVLLYEHTEADDTGGAVVIRPFEPRLERQRVVVTPAEVPHSPICSLFIEEFRRRAAELTAAW